MAAETPNPAHHEMRDPELDGSNRPFFADEGSSIELREQSNIIMPADPPPVAQDQPEEGEKKSEPSRKSSGKA